MIIYIHGFKSAGGGAKADCLKALFPDETVLSPTLSPSPAAAIDLLNSIIEPGTTVVGTSLGGFYAAYLYATNPDVRQALIINPVVDPPIKMACHLGEQVNFKNKERFNWTTEHLAELQVLADAMLTAEVNWHDARFVAGSEDSQTNPETVKAWYGCASVHIYKDDHPFRRCFSRSVSDHLLPK
jgi:predicted esterase YcpF (UPF0227 family)